ncbi:hypothetical protein [Adlercreutzia sp. ZJ304]|uniref:hypothetical protein n=1 Tax=Adlercreutzia sp. ZJ304 TaxID=2709791 RepID=UPI0013EC4F2F|nr:hypothetical protein [Adlercreutzia sp. ZJ304]
MTYDDTQGAKRANSQNTQDAFSDAPLGESAKSATNSRAYEYGIAWGANRKAAPQSGANAAHQQSGANAAQQQARPAATATAAASAPHAQRAPHAQQPLQPAQESRKRKHGAGFWIGIIVAIVALILAALLAFNMCSGGGRGARQGDQGQLAGKTDAEIQAELDRVVEEGMFNISIASVIEFENGTAPGEVRIENVPNNRYLMRVEVVRDDTGEVIYTTDYVEPNHHIQTDTLDVALPAGTYDCTANFFAYDMETEDEVGQAAAKVVVKVLG